MVLIAIAFVLGSVVLAYLAIKRAIQDFADAIDKDVISLREKGEASQMLLSILSAAVNGSKEAVIAVDASNRVLFLNPTAEVLTGWKFADASKKPLSSVVDLKHETTLRRVESPALKVLNDGLSHDLATLTVLESQTGSHKPVDGRSLPLLTGNERTGAVLILRDSSVGRAARESKRNIERLKAAIVESSLDCIILLDEKGNIVDMNPVATRTFSSKSDVLVGKQFFTKVLLSASSSFVAMEFEKAVAFGQTDTLKRSTEVVALRADGTEFHAEMAITELPGESPKVYAAYIVDITDRLAARNAERNARTAAETESREKSAFLADMSDELRTPLNAIIGYTEILIEAAEEQELDGFASDLEKIREAGLTLNTQVCDILDLARLESGRVKLNLENIKVQELLSDFVRTALPALSSNGNRLEIDIATEIRDMYSDKLKLKQGLLNLVSNASRHTRDRKLLLRLESRTEDGVTWMCFHVSDVTTGLPATEIDSLVDAYMSGGAPSRARFGGNGLGLVIVRHFCEMLGGRAVSSRQIGHGATFGMEVPLVSAYS
jgi:PAS domain S-box-containing protein